MTNELSFTEHSLIQLMISVGAKDYKIIDQDICKPWTKKPFSWSRKCIYKCLHKMEGGVNTRVYNKNLLMIFYNS